MKMKQSTIILGLLCSLFLLSSLVVDVSSTPIESEMNYNDGITDSHMSVYYNGPGDYQNLAITYAMGAGDCLIRGVEIKYNNIGSGPYGIEIQLSSDYFYVNLIDTEITHVSDDTWKTYLYSNPTYLIDDDPGIIIKGMDPSDDCLLICLDQGLSGHSLVDSGSGSWGLISNFEIITNLLYERIINIGLDEMTTGNITTTDNVDAFKIDLNAGINYKFNLSRTSGTGDLNIRIQENAEITSAIEILAASGGDNNPEIMEFSPSISGSYLLLVEAKNPGVDTGDYSMTCSEKTLPIINAPETDLTYNFRWSYDFGEIIDSSDVKITPDMNGDALDDILVYTKSGSTEKVTAFTHEGEELWNVDDFHPGLLTYDSSNLRGNGEMGWYYKQYDENNDGTPDILGRFLNKSVAIIDGNTGDTLWVGAPMGTDDYFEAVLEDFSGDGKPEILMKSGTTFGVLKSDDKSIMWSNEYGYSPHLNPIPDVNGDGIWDVITGANYVSSIHCWSGFDGSLIWSHQIGLDSWGEAVCPDQNGDGYFDVLIASQNEWDQSDAEFLGEYELISGKTGNQIWGADYLRISNPDYYIDEQGIGYTMYYDDPNTLRTYYLSNGTYIGSKISDNGDRCFLENPNHTPNIFQLVLSEADQSLGIYALGNYDTPVQVIEGDWKTYSTFYGHPSYPTRDIVLVNSTHLVLYNDPEDSFYNDSDGDSILDWEENIIHFTNPYNNDTDNDGILDDEELILGVDLYITNPLSNDTDIDGMADLWEITNSLNPTLGSDNMTDSDSDGLSNIFEFLNGTDPWNADCDEDGILDGAEINQYQTDPLNNDTDGDLMPDLWEITFGLNPTVANSFDDPDFDGLENLHEFTNSTDPLDSDSDDDGMMDGWEVDFLLDPLNGTDGFQDPDFDGLENLYEFTNSTDPFDSDSDDDGILDYEEVVVGLDGYITNPISDDTDFDGMADLWEITNSLNPTLGSDNMTDSDSDGLSNIFEFLNGTDPWNADCDDDGLFDGMEINIYNTNPLSNDTDSDLLPDSWEITHDTDPTVANSFEDPDNDQLTNYDEYIYGTNPNNEDTDGDGYSDKYEIDHNTDPNDKNDPPIIILDTPWYTKAWVWSAIGASATVFFGFIGILKKKGVKPGNLLKKFINRIKK